MNVLTLDTLVGAGMLVIASVLLSGVMPMADSE